MLKHAALFATAFAALQCALAERSSSIDRPVAEIRVVSSDAGARPLMLGVDKAMAIDLPTDIREVFVADSQTVRVVVRTLRRVYVVGVAVGRTNIFFYDDDGRQVIALDISVSSQMPLPETRVPDWQQVGTILADSRERSLRSIGRLGGGSFMN